MTEELPLPDPEMVYLLTDEIATCPHCGARSDWVDVGPLKQVHTCLNPSCRFIFYAEWDEAELDEDGNFHNINDQCEVDDCFADAYPCECGVNHCTDHPHDRDSVVY